MRIFLLKNFAVCEKCIIFALGIYKCKIRRQNYKKKMTYTSKMNKILVEHGLRMKIHMVLGYSRPTINEALAGRSETAIARKIRLYALRNGGVEVPSNNNQ